MKEKNKRKLAIAVSVLMLFAPVKEKGLEYKTLPEEPIKIEEPIKLKRRVK